jgi:tetratricopeptide (TPR) repeat protein
MIFPSVRSRLALVCLLAVAVTPLSAQTPFVEDRPILLVPLRPQTQKQRDRRESLHEYALGLLCQREDRLLEALAAFEKAAQLDPKAPAVYRAIIPLQLALERTAEAIATTRKVLALDPDDFETWYVYARELRVSRKAREACAALERALGCAGLKERPELAQQIHFDLGVLRERAHEFAAAAAAFAEAARVMEHPDHEGEFGTLSRAETAARIAMLYERVGRDYLEGGKYAEAVTAFRKAQAADPATAGRLSLNLAQVCGRMGKHAEALAYVDGYLKLQPQGTDAYELKADLLHQLNRDAELLPWLEKASADDQYNVRLKLLLARQYAQARLEDRAEKVYTTLAAEAPTPEIYQALFGLYKKEGKLGGAKALTVLDRTFATALDRQAPGRGLAGAQARAMLAALRDDKELARDLIQAGATAADKVKMQAETLQMLATLAEQGKDVEHAERFYRLALTATPERDRAVVCGGLLRVLWAERKYTDVAEVCRGALKTAGDADRVVYGTELARALARLEQFDEALKEADAALKVAAVSDRLGVRHLRVRILIEAARYDKAEAECRAMLKEFTLPGEVLELHYLLSSVYSQAGQTAKAEEELQECLRLDPSNATVNNDLGYVWADQNKNLDRAEEMIRKAIDLDRKQRKGPGAAADGPDDGDNAAYTDSLGWVLFRKGDLAGARRELERAGALPDGDDPVIWDHLGDVYLRLNLRDRARGAWERAAHFYERDRRGRMERRYRELQEKRKLLEQGRQPE